MNRIVFHAMALGLLAAAVAAGYWWGRHETASPAPAAVASAPATPATTGRRILYYRNPMGLPDISPVPKKDQMGMDYIPVYEGEETDAGSTDVRVSADKLQKLGVRTEVAELRDLTRTVRAVGTLQVDERRVHTISPKFEGWIERLHANATGQPVARGQPLMEVYSPDLITAQQEYLIALKGTDAVRHGGEETNAGMQQLVSGALQRLRNWDISEEEIERLQRERVARRSLALRAPAGGVILEKPALKGMRFMPGEAILKIADLSSLWLLAEIFEQDLALVRTGQPVQITVKAHPGRVYTGKVSFVYPTLTPGTRTARIRVELPNPGGQLRPEMYASVEISAGQSRAKVLSVPDSAVIDSGTRQIVLVQRDAGRFEPRTVKLGARGDSYVEVTEGIAPGERIVVSANFLIDSESNLKAALRTFGTTPAAPAGEASRTTPPTSGPVHRSRGTVEAIDPGAGELTITHEPIPSLQWPAMTMPFAVTNRSLLDGLKPKQNVQFEIVQKGPGEFVIVGITPAGAAAPGKPAPEKSAHEGH